MSILFVPSKVKSHLDPSGNPKYIARPYGRRPAGMTELVRAIEKYSSLTEVEIYGVILALAHIIPELLGENRNVHIPKLGIFSCSLVSDTEKKPGDVDRHTIKGIRVQFRPSKEFRDRINDIRFEKYKD